jgi:outer membrane protein assembly factor BamB
MSHRMVWASDGRRGALLGSVLLMLALSNAPGQEWTRFRGPNGSGVSTTTGMPVTWTERNVLWRIPIAGQSHSQPVIWGERLFLTSATGEGRERLLLCLRKNDGKELWRKSYVLPTPRTKNRNSGYANSSPVVDAKRVIACFVSAEHFWVRCYDHDGNTQWERDLGPFDSGHGHGASPIICENTVVIVKDQDEDSFVAALSLESGNLLWKAPRRVGGGAAAYGTPTLGVRSGEPPELFLTSRSHGISSLDARTGVLNWQAPVLKARTIGSPVVAGELVIGTCGQGVAGPNFLAAVRTGGKGDVSSTHVAYTLRAGTPCVPTPLCWRDRLYLVSDAGIASAVEIASGRVIWSERLGAEFMGSPVLIEGRIYAPSTKGELIVFAAGDEFKLLVRFPLGEGTQSSPCVDAGRIYIKTLTHLACLGEPP